MDTISDICLTVYDNEQNYNYYLILIDSDWSKYFAYRTYNIPVDCTYSMEKVSKIANECFEMLPNAFNKRIAKINEHTYDVYCKLANFRKLLYYLPCLDDLERGRDLTLEKQVEDECYKLIKELDKDLKIDFKTDVILDLGEQPWKWC